MRLALHRCCFNDRITVLQSMNTQVTGQATKIISRGGNHEYELPNRPPIAGIRWMRIDTDPVSNRIVMVIHPRKF